jgi:hypothetical protein
LVAFLLALSFQASGRRRRVARLTIVSGIILMLVLIGAASAAGFSSKAFFYLTGFTTMLWLGGLNIPRPVIIFAR